MNHRMFRLLLNIYPPYWGTGIVVSKVAPDFTEIVVQMKKRFYNRNYVDTHFGGSLYSMVDPFYMLMLINILGKDYVVWDKSAFIDFVKPGRGKVKAVFSITQETISDIVAKTADGEKYLPELTVEIEDEAGETVARAVKTIYVRKRRASEDPRRSNIYSLRNT
jgi:acyl-coenzyme A thioesterase PaaI-like protein